MGLWARLPRTLWGRPSVTALIAAEKGVSSVLVAGGAALAFFVHDRVVDNPLWLRLPDEVSGNPRHLLFLLLHRYVPTLGPRTVLLIAVFLVFWAILLGLESIGVWWDYAWGEMLIIVETVSFMPIELYHIVRHPALTGFASLGLNVLILWYVGRLYQRRMALRAADRSVAFPAGTVAVVEGAPRADAAHRAGPAGRSPRPAPAGRREPAGGKHVLAARGEPEEGT